MEPLLTDSIELITKENIGLYRDNGLILLRNINSQQTNRLQKRIIKKLQSIGFKIEMVTNLQKVDFLDVTLNLISNTYCPYKKPNENLTYINTSSNQPPNKKNLKFYGPFLWMGFNYLKAAATSRRQFTFYHSVPTNSWCSFYRPQKDEGLSRPWSHPVVFLNTGPLDWESSALTTTPLLHEYHQTAH